ncbi:MAG: ATP-binding protein, partial [Hyphomicrobiales bacterium]|nr:ATP-binding protein [Hyphomicrobiales bacterium]
RQRPDGMVLEIRGFPLPEGGFVTTYTDITERKNAEEALRENEQLFSKAFHANPIALSISAIDGAIHDANEAWLTTTGFTREETIGNSSIEMGIWADPRDRAKYVEQLKNDGIVKAFETQYLTKSGEMRDILLSGEYVEVAGERLMFNLSNDITESKRANMELVQHRDQLQELVDKATVELKEKARQLELALTKEKKLNELQRQFVSTASHEFRTPLAIIDSSVQRLMRSKNKLTPHVLEERATRIRDAVKVMSNLMESTLSAASMDADTVKMKLGPCDLRAIISEVCDRQKDVKDDRKLHFDSGDIPDRIKSDKSVLNQIFTNLVSNAVKYSSEGSEITIEGRREDEEVVVSVRDHGIGIDEDDLPKMFTRFFRAKTSTGIAGTGIGLNLVKTLVEMQGGSVSVQSIKGEGSTFTVRLPIDGPSHTELTETKVA